MYNTERYIGANLESLLNQTFKNFEVIVVDDCSTDNSCAVVESFVPKFDGRLKLLKLEKNSGGPAKPANKGVAFSRGKYIHVMDSDDLLVSNALEILYNLAESYEVDLVCLDLGYKITRNGDKPIPTKDDVDVVGWHGGPFIDKPTLESADIAERVKKIARNGVGWTVWEKFVRRDFLVENDITFTEIRLSHDIVWVIETFCLAKKILTIPDLIYVFRMNPTSLTHTKRTEQQRLDIFMSSHIGGMKALCDFFDKHKFFRDNPQYQTALLGFWEGIHFNNIRELIEKMPEGEIFATLEKIFREKFGAYGNVIAYLCQSSNLSRYRLIAAYQHIEKIEGVVRALKD